MQKIHTKAMISFFLNFLFIYSHVHTLFGPFLTPALYLLPFPFTPPHFQAEPVILLKRRHKHNKKDKAFLLVEIG
jgi:hypothetical protein